MHLLDPPSIYPHISPESKILNLHEKTEKTFTKDAVTLNSITIHEAEQQTDFRFTCPVTCDVMETEPLPPNRCLQLCVSELLGLCPAGASQLNPHQLQAAARAKRISQQGAINHLAVITLARLWFTANLVQCGSNSTCQHSDPSDLSSIRLYWIHLCLINVFVQIHVVMLYEARWGFRMLLPRVRASWQTSAPLKCPWTRHWTPPSYWACPLTSQRSCDQNKRYQSE